MIKSRITYDTLGNLLTIDDGMNTVEYVYDVNANVLLERLGSDSVSFAYNADRTKRFIGYADAHYRLVRDESGNLSEIRKGLESYALQYDPLGNQTTLTYPNRLTQKSQYDPLGRIAKSSFGDNEPLTYLYDKSSRIVMKNTTAYRYDEAGRIAASADENYRYDEVGNLLRGECTIDSLTGRLLVQDDTRFSYDGLGRLIEKRSPTTKTTYAYDVEGYLIQYARHSISPVIPDPVRPEPVEGLFVHGSTSSPRMEIRFTYDPLGRRLTKHYKDDVTEYHHRYLYAGDNIVAIYDAKTDEVLATLLHDEGIDTPLSISLYDKEVLSSYELESMSEDERYLHTQSLIRTYYYHRDHQNSIIALSDKEGKIIESYSYDPFGLITHRTKTVETYNPYGYTARERDTDDLYYYRARYYDPTIGRFITPDPIGFLGGDMNLYRYVGNDPVNFRDPSGFSGMTALLNQHNPIRDLVEWWNSTPDTSIPTTSIPNSTIPQGKINTQTDKPKTATTQNATIGGASNSTGAKISGNTEKKVDEKCKDQKWHDPIDNPQLAMYTQGGHVKPWWNVFGEVRKGNTSSNHQGVDLFAVPGTPVYACVDSTIAHAGYTGKGYGNVIVLKAKCPDFVRSLKQAYNMPYAKHGEKMHGIDFNENGDFYFMYAHLSKISTKILDKQKAGEKIQIKAGDMIGEIGTSGYKTSRDPHLHFEILNTSHGRKGLNNRVNPGFYLNYKLPYSLQEKELQLQKDVAKSKTGDTRQGDPSLKK